MPGWEVGVGLFGIRLDFDSVLPLGLLDYEDKDKDGLRKDMLRWWGWLVKLVCKAPSWLSSWIAIESCRWRQSDIKWIAVGCI